MGRDLPNAAGQAPAAGAIEIAAYAKAPAGQPEPVRQMTFLLLRRSVTQIAAEAQQTEPALNLDHFVDGLELSAEMKVWMKKHQTVDLAGEDFIRLLTPDDVVEVPEFLEAYKLQNGSALHAVLPEPKIKDKDAQKNPEKFQKDQERYRQALRRYIQANPDTLNGIDAEFNGRNPMRHWTQLQAEQQKHIDFRISQLAQTEYLAAKTTSDLEGRARITGLQPGEYWITNLDTPAFAGDLRLRWDARVSVHAGETTHAELSNFNALETERGSHSQ
jgi:hypothetical protein